MANQLRQQIEQISREKNINPEVIIAAIEDAILTASKKYYKGAEDLRSRFNDETGQIEVFAVKQIVETVEIPETQIGLEEARKLIPEAEVGPGDRVPEAHRHARPHRRPDREAGHLPEGARGRARQRLRRVLGPRGRGGERHHQAPGDGRLRRRPRAAPRRVLPRKEQSRAETYQTGDRVRVAIVRSLKAAKGPQVVVSRTDPALLVKLFEMEVPEIYDGTVQIKGCVREAGERAKVAVDLARARRRPGGRLRRHEGHPRAVDHPRAARREDRHRRVERRPDRLRA